MIDVTWQHEEPDGWFNDADGRPEPVPTVIYDQLWAEMFGMPDDEEGGRHAAPKPSPTPRETP